MRMIEGLIVYLHALKAVRSFACVNSDSYQRMGVFALCWPVSKDECRQAEDQPQEGICGPVQRVQPRVFHDPSHGRARVALVISDQCCSQQSLSECFFFYPPLFIAARSPVVGTKQHISRETNF